MQLEAADHNSSVMEPLLSPDDVTIPPRGHTVITIQSHFYTANAVRGILQPSEKLHEEDDRNILRRNSHSEWRNHSDMCKNHWSTLQT